MGVIMNVSGVRMGVIINVGGVLMGVIRNVSGVRMGVMMNLAEEKLAEESLVLSHDTLTTLLKERGLWRRRRRRGRHRSRRVRRACFGSMVQMDGSHHHWLEGRADKCVLMVLIDDATSRTYARFYPAETTRAALDGFGRWTKRHGLPRSVYVDRHSIYRDEDHPQKPTQFGRAMKQLGVELICAHSPQAMGRVERRNAVVQDRLVKELRLRGSNDIHGANAVLEGKLLDEVNRRYAVSPAMSGDRHRVVEADVEVEEVLCAQEPRVVGQDWCVRWQSGRAAAEFRFLFKSGCGVSAALSFPGFGWMDEWSGTSWRWDADAKNTRKRIRQQR